MDAHFDRLFRLAQKTGDTLIVYDKQTEQHHVIMDIDKYETLVQKGEAEVFSTPKEKAPEFSYIEDNYTPPSNTKSEQWSSHAEAEPQNDWHAAGDILDNLHPEFNDESDALEAAEEIFDEPLFDEIDAEDDTEDPHFEAQEPEQPLEYDPVMQEPSPIPMVDAKEEEMKDVFNEEPLQEEPIFFEEPLT